MTGSRREAHPRYAALTDVGRVRSANEDSYLAEPPLFAVADGLGGHQAGEIASRIAIDTLLASAPRKADARALGRAVRAANVAVIQAAERGHGRAGMGTTLTAAMVEGTRIVLAHAGDSRAYLFAHGRLQRITRDHSMVADLVRRGELTEEESRHHPNRSVVTRALGSDPEMPADTHELDAGPGDRLLLCTDGLHGMLTDDRIEALAAAFPDPEDVARALVAEALLGGGYDNVTVVVVDIAETGPERASERRISVRRWWAASLWAVVAAAIIVTGSLGAYTYARSRAYLTAESGVVVIRRGLPGSFAGIRLDWREQETTLALDAVASADPVMAQRLRLGLVVRDLAEARRVAEDLRALVASASAAP